MKNKNKSKKVQKYVETVKKQVDHKVDGPRRGGGAGAGAGSAASAVRMQQMAARLAELELMNQPVKAKDKKMSAEEAERKRIEEEEEAERIRIANLPVEDQIEEERAKLTSRTPVTLELFQEWKANNDRAREEKIAAARALAMKKATKAERARGQNLTGLTGRELFQIHQEIFVDDADATTENLRATNDYVGSDDEDETEPQDSSQVQADESLFSGAAGSESATPPDTGVGDASLFS